MNINRALLIYTAVITSGILFSSLRSSLGPDPNNRLSHDLAEVKDTVDKMNQRFATEEGILTKEVTALKAQIAAAENPPAEVAEKAKSDTLGAAAASLGFIKVSPGYESLDTYETTSFSSPVVGKLISDKPYPYIKKQDNWLLVKFDNKEGWVNSKLVTNTEVQDSSP